jgi:hypothetical protein
MKLIFNLALDGVTSLIKNSQAKLSASLSIQVVLFFVKQFETSRA